MTDTLNRYFKEDAKRISFGTSLTPIVFEEKLTQYYKKSHKYPAIDFDLSLVEWVSLLELLLLIQWINHLSNQGKQIRVIFPYTAYLVGFDDQSTKIHHRGASYDQIYRRQKVSDFLCRLQFHEILKEILGEYPIVFHKGTPLPLEVFQEIDFQDPDPFQERLLSLKPFQSETELNVTEELKNEKLRNILKTHSCLDPVDSGMLADVAIKELASNAIQHGIQREEINIKLFSNIGRPYLPAWVSARLVKSSWKTQQEAPQWLSKVYDALLGKNYVELAISDPGFGIYTTLKDHVPKFLFEDKPTVKGILDYAFDKFSSSKSQKKKDMDRFPTGLFLVYNLVKDNGGVLILRSSGFFMGYDFLNNNKDPRLLDLSDETGKCIDVGGTALQIILPESRGSFDIAPLHEDDRQFVEPEVFPIDFPDLHYQGEVDTVNSVVSEIKEKCQKEKNTPIIVDMLGFDLNNTQHAKFMLQFIRYILYLENPNLIILFINSDNQLFQAINHFINNGSIPSNKLLTISTDEISSIFSDLKPHIYNICPILKPSKDIFWLGANETEIKILDHLWNVGEEEINNFGDNYLDAIRISKTNKYLISSCPSTIDKSLGFLMLRYGLYDHVHSFPSIIERHTYDIIEKSPYTIYKGENDCYHLPHGEYSHQFISLYSIFNNDKLLDRLSQYLLTLLYLKSNIKDVDIVIGGTYSAQPLIHCIAKQLGAEFIVIDRYIDQIEDPHISALVQGKHAIIVTDVISSGSFVESIENRLVHEKVIIESICCICDLRSAKYNKLGLSKNPIISLVQLPTDKFNHPDRNNIWEVNPISLRLSKLDEIRSKDTVPSITKSKDLTEWINQSSSLVPSHITLGPTHYTYFIDTEQILNTFAGRIFNLVFSDIINFFKENSQYKTHDISFLLTPKGSNAELYFPDIIKKTFPQLKWIKLDRQRFSSEGFWRVDGLDEKLESTKQIKNSIVLIWDDGTNTGRTLMQMLKLISDCKPKLILAYCLVNRMPAYMSLLLNSITEMADYSKVRIRFISNVPIGTYTLANCPLCNFADPRVPPIKDILIFWSKENESNGIREWNHLSKKKILEDSRMYLRQRGIENVDDFIGKIFKIRCEIGKFELYTNISQDERNELYSFIDDDEMLAALCYLFNREPDLLTSIIKYQIKDFKKMLLNAVISKICHSSSVKMEGKQDIIHFVANNDPHLVINNLNPLLKNIFNAEKLCIRFLAVAISHQNIKNTVNLLDQLVEKLKSISYRSSQSNYLLGLSNACLLWAKSEEERERSDTLHNTISDLQLFYSSEHSGSVEFGSPLHDIVSSLFLINEGKYDKEYINTIYRNWRELTVYMTNMRIIPSINTLKDILNQEIPSGIRKYYVSTKDGFLRDYYEIERLLTLIKESTNPKLISKEDIASLRKAVQRFYNYLFKKNNYLSNTVSKIPAYIIKKIDEHLVIQKQWIEKAGIQLVWEPDLKSDEIDGLMTSRSFKRVLREIFLNIQKHNFSIHDSDDVIKDCYKNHSIDISLETTDKKVTLQIRSDGPAKYDGSKSEGIRTLENMLLAYEGKFNIVNNDNWVENIVEIKRW